jgi:polyisoprenyl-phosphate glycosyltransferase
MKLSIVIPVYNSEQTVEPLVTQLFDVLRQYKLEVVLINDGSKDGSEMICENMAINNKKIKFISLRKNKGEHNAVMCGLNFCTGDYVAIIDDDFQNPPSQIITLLNAAVWGKYDVVYAKYEEKKHSIVRNLYSKINNAFATHLMGKPKGLYLCSFKVIKRELVDEVINYRGPFPYIDALILRSTDNIGSETVLHESRKNGASNYTFRKLVSLYLNGFINFSFKPLRFITIAGFLISLLSFIMSIDLIYEKISGSNDIVPGWTFLAVLLLFSFGITFIAIGLLGEYIGKILMALNGAPQFVIKKTVNTTSVHEKVTTKDYDWETVRV